MARFLPDLGLRPKEGGRFGANGLRSCALHQLEAIAEGIEDVDAAEVVEGRVGRVGRPARSQAATISSRLSTTSAGCARLAGWKSVGLDAKVEIHRACHEPDAVASCHRDRLCDFGETENSDVKRRARFFAASGNRELHVIEAKDWHRAETGSGAAAGPRRDAEIASRAGLRRGTSGWLAGTAL